MPDDVLKLTATHSKDGGIEVRAETLESSEPKGTPIAATYAMMINLLDQSLHVYAEENCDCPACLSERTALTAALSSARVIVLAVMGAETRRMARRSAKADAADPASLCEEPPHTIN
jgi:DNA-binding helix-hairpin-helix protein with protein kinase domain